MKHFTEEHVNYISENLYDWISDKNGDNPWFREASISLIRLGLSKVSYRAEKNGNIKLSDINAILPRLMIQINNIGVNAEKCKEPDNIYLSLPEKTRTEIYDYVMESLRHGDDGTLLSGIIKNHILNIQDEINLISESTKEKHIGEIRLMNCGQTCTVIGWYKGEIVLRFEDGTIVENKRYEDFKKGAVMNPVLMDLTGYRFNNFEVVGLTGASDKHRNKLWYCRCSCGKIVELSRPQILGRCGCPKSCGCKK